ncbi:unnamed protein product [Brassica rapa]|uniref:Uncharacterized protein n=3 Tax=Brassica TaxID=3705 RepID=A0A3P5ZTG6_BRACM|nr:unnamed protein product [Brassica napus]CAG7888236.1 unnamed protein product [Brassica rapa]VDC75680.1 unnamed protein product [Brassica rapa]
MLSSTAIETHMSCSEIGWLKNDGNNDGSKTVVQGGRWFRLRDDESIMQSYELGERMKLLYCRWYN